MPRTIFGILGSLPPSFFWSLSFYPSSLIPVSPVPPPSTPVPPIPPVQQHSPQRVQRHAGKRLGWLLGKLAFLKGNLRFILCWPLAAFIGITLAWSIFYHNLHAQKQQVTDVAMADVSIIARNHASHVKRSIDSIDQMLLLIKLQWEASGGTMRLETLKGRGLFSSGVQINAAIVDRDGMLVTSTFDAKLLKPSNYAGDRPYFLIHKKSVGDFLHIGKPTIGRATGREIIQYSRALVDADNAFDGVVLMSMESSYLNDDYDTITLGQHGMLGTLGTDGQLRSARVGNTMQPAEPRFLTSALPMPLGDVDEMLNSSFVEGSKTFLDHRNRYVSSHPVVGYPMVAFAGIDEQEAMTPYWHRRHTDTVTALWTTLAVLLFTGLSMAFSMRVAWRRHQLEIARASHRMASESGSEAFYLAEAVHNAGGTTIDFTVTDCNERCAVFFQRHCNEMQGELVSVLHGPVYFPACRDMLLAALTTGEQTGELTLANGPLGRQRFVHVSARAADGRLAVTMRDITPEKELIRSLERRTHEDILTGLPNRAWATSFLPGAIARARARQHRVAVHFIDLDGFKAVNDGLGHAAGDEVLRMAGRRLLAAAGTHTYVVRFGGDEFLIIQEAIDDNATLAQGVQSAQGSQSVQAASVAQRVIDAFTESFVIAENHATIGTSIGISLFPDDADDAETLIRHADTAMYEIKMADKHGYRFFEA